MAIMKMKRLSVCALNKNRKQILESLQGSGTLEIEFDNITEQQDTSSKRAVFERCVQTLEEALTVLDKYAPENSSLLSSLAGKNQIERQHYDKLVSKRDEAIDTAKKIIELNSVIEENNAEIARLNAECDALKPWLNLTVPLNKSGTKKTDIRFGIISGKMSEDELSQELSDFAAAWQTVSRDKNSWYVMVITKKDDTAAVADILRKCGFSSPPKTCSEIPAKQTEILAAKADDFEAKNKAAAESIKAFANRRQELMIIADYYRIRADKYAVLGRIALSKHTFCLSGYVPEKYADAVAKALSERYGAAVELEETDDTPIELENNSFVESFEGVLESFGLPKKGEFDPTGIMSAFYVFLFGLMLSDAAYGAVISIACFTLLKRFKNMESSMRKSLKMFMYCGISTLFWGILFGGYFGDAIDVISRTFFGKEMSVPPLWFTPLNNPMKLLLYSLLFGLIHLFTGLALKGYMYIKDNDYKSFVYDVVSWFMLLFGLIMLLLESSIFASLSGKAVKLGDVGHILAIVLAIAGTVTILLTAGRSSKNAGIRLAKGAYSLYDITSWLSDVLSYSRLLALGLATGVIASVINQMGTMAGKSVLGAIVFIVVFVLGHTLNLAINLLGAYVHTNRLQYVEFFGKFYEGGGRKFNPFKENTKYIKIK